MAWISDPPRRDCLRGGIFEVPFYFLEGVRRGRHKFKCLERMNIVVICTPKNGSNSARLPWLEPPVSASSAGPLPIKFITFAIQKNSGKSIRIV